VLTFLQGESVGRRKPRPALKNGDQAAAASRGIDDLDQDLVLRVSGLARADVNPACEVVPLR
jgi:hypothetical protein